MLPSQLLGLLDWKSLPRGAVEAASRVLPDEAVDSPRREHPCAAWGRWPRWPNGLFHLSCLWLVPNPSRDTSHQACLSLTQCDDGLENKMGICSNAIFQFLYLMSPGKTLGHGVTSAKMSALPTHSPHLRPPSTPPPKPGEDNCDIPDTSKWKTNWFKKTFWPFLCIKDKQKTMQNPIPYFLFQVPF